MRLPHHLKVASNGIYYFRLAVPLRLRPLLKKTELVRSLGTRDPRAAKLLAYGLSAQLLAEFGMGDKNRHMKKPTLEEAIQAARDGTPYTLKLPNGTVLEAKDQADHARAIEAIGMLKEAGAFAMPVLASPSVPIFTGKPIKLSEARKLWLAHIQDKTKPKTLTIKDAAVRDLESHIGDRTLHTITRTDLSEFCQHLQSRLERPTVANKFIYLKGFFEVMIGKGHYSKGDNPAEGQIAYTKKDKRARKKYGQEPFTDTELRKIFSPDAYLKLKQPSEYWAPLISLFTGARVNEICQLTLDDFIEEEGYFCVSINDEETKSTKTESSIRLVPLHSYLIKLGLKDYIEEVRSRGYKQLFPNLQPALNGFGDAESKAFIRHIERLGIKPKEGRKSFHSFRSTVIQRLQTKKVNAEFRCQFVGHDLSDVHFNYSRHYTAMELAVVVHPALCWELDFEKLKQSPSRFNGRFVRKKKPLKVTGQ